MIPVALAVGFGVGVGIRAAVVAVQNKRHVSKVCEDLAGKRMERTERKMDEMRTTGRGTQRQWRKLSRKHLKQKVKFALAAERHATWTASDADNRLIMKTGGEDILWWSVLFLVYFTEFTCPWFALGLSLYMLLDVAAKPTLMCAAALGVGVARAVLWAVKRAHDVYRFFKPVRTTTLKPGHALVLA